MEARLKPTSALVLTNRHLIKNYSGISITEVIFCIFLFNALAFSLFGSIKSLLKLSSSSKIRARVVTQSIVLKSHVTRALAGGSQYLPIAAVKVSVDPAQRFSPVGKYLVSAEAVPEYIFQISRQQNSTNIFCRYPTSLSDNSAAPMRGLLSLGISGVAVNSANSINRVRNAAYCETSSQAYQIRLTELENPLFSRSFRGRTEVIIPLIDVYAIYLNTEGQLRRFSYLTNEHQTLLKDLLEFELIETTPELLEVRYSFKGMKRTDRFYASKKGTDKIDILDLFW